MTQVRVLCHSYVLVLSSWMISSTSSCNSQRGKTSFDAFFSRSFYTRKEFSHFVNERRGTYPIRNSPHHYRIRASPRCTYVHKTEGEMNIWCMRLCCVARSHVFVSSVNHIDKTRFYSNSDTKIVHNCLLFIFVALFFVSQSANDETLVIRKDCINCHRHGKYGKSLPKITWNFSWMYLKKRLRKVFVSLHFEPFFDRF